MKLFCLIAGLALLSLAPSVSVKDFKPAFGKWKGSLTYLDYSSGKPYSMPANITVRKDKADRNNIILFFEYPDEPKANGNDTLRISGEGTMLNGETIILKEKKDDMLQVTTQKDGVDGNDSKPALIRHVYMIGKKTFSSRKEVKFAGEEKWILRNEYKMSR